MGPVCEEPNPEIPALRREVQEMIGASNASVIHAMRIIMVNFNRDVDQVQSSGADDGSAALDPGNAVLLGGTATECLFLLLLCTLDLLRESPQYEKQQQQEIRCSVTVRYEMSERWNAEELLSLSRLARRRTNHTNSEELEAR